MNWAHVPRRILMAIKWRLLRLVQWLRLVILDRIWLFIFAKTHKCIFVFGSPFHNNLGDNAQTLCIAELLKKEYPQYKVKFFTDGYLAFTGFKVIPYLSRVCRKDAMVMLHSGYHMTDLYMWVELANRYVVKSFRDRPILAFPQTIFYKSDKELKKAEEIYNSHPCLTIMCRDEVSFSFAQVHFSKCRLLLMPDIVTTMIGKYDFRENRKGILLCKRNDKESKFSNAEIESLITRLGKFDTVEVADTTVMDSWATINKDLKKYLENVWTEYSRYKVIVTDRYHGTIFSLIANTPVVVIPSNDHKVSSGVKWFPESFGDYVRFAPTFDDVESEVGRIFSKLQLDHKLPPYFSEKYYDGLCGKIGWGNDAL